MRNLGFRRRLSPPPSNGNSQQRERQWSRDQGEITMTMANPIHHGNITAKGRRARRSYRSSPEICDGKYLSELESERTILARGRFGKKNVGRFII